jgi:hypothetical protein
MNDYLWVLFLVDAFKFLPSVTTRYYVRDYGRKQGNSMVRNIVHEVDSRSIFIRSYISKPQINT